MVLQEELTSRLDELHGQRCAAQVNSMNRNDGDARLHEAEERHVRARNSKAPEIQLRFSW
ncbi:hypothetical protein [Sorangium sp. So ce1151]|uniref:hypothetical protein n=1 Tax=Sorangium sp. So ce1151 TaxID=3133332 RepID=UPI003F5D6729